MMGILERHESLKRLRPTEPEAAHYLLDDWRSARLFERVEDELPHLLDLVRRKLGHEEKIDPVIYKPWKYRVR